MENNFIENNPTKKVLTLCIIHQNQRILLGMKKRGFGAGRWNGFGGKVKDDESIKGAAKRELFEEAGIEARDIKEAGVLDFSWQGKPEILEVNVFKVCQFDGEPRESEEMKPRWFCVDEIPFADMWPDDRYWMPLFLQDKKFKGKFIFAEKDNIITKELFKI